jgi:hypothetical protein
MDEISINNFVEITISTSQPSVSERNVNTIALFTKDTNLRPVGDYTVYKEPSAALQDWGSDSISYRAVNTVFSQSPNVNSGNGYVIVAKLKTGVTIAATAAYVRFNDLILANFQKVTAGDVNLQFGDDDPIAFTGLDFSGATSIEDLATIMQEALEEHEVDDVLVTSEENSITMTRAETGYSDERITLTGTLAGIDYLNYSGATHYDGSDAYLGYERLQDAMARIGNIIFFGAALPLYDETDANILAAADYVSSRPQLLVVPRHSESYLQDNALFDNIRKSMQTKVRCLYYGHATDKFIFAAAYLGNWLTTDFSGSNSLRNLHAKTLAGTTPDYSVDQTKLNMAYRVGADVYVAVSGVGAVFCSGANEWFDTQYGLNALRIALENAAFTTFREGNKIPQTIGGIALLENSYRSVCLAFARAGLIGPGKWNLPYSFGDPEDFEISIGTYGIYLYTESLEQQLPASRSQRFKPSTYIAIKLQGAFNKDFIFIIKND